MSTTTINVSSQKSPPRGPARDPRQRHQHGPRRRRSLRPRRGLHQARRRAQSRPGNPGCDDGRPVGSDRPSDGRRRSERSSDQGSGASCCDEAHPPEQVRSDEPEASGLRLHPDAPRQGRRGDEGRGPREGQGYEDRPRHRGQAAEGPHQGAAAGRDDDVSVVSVETAEARSLYPLNQILRALSPLPFKTPLRALLPSLRDGTTTPPCRAHASASARGGGRRRHVARSNPG